MFENKDLLKFSERNKKYNVKSEQRILLSLYQTAIQLRRIYEERTGSRNLIRAFLFFVFQDFVVDVLNSRVGNSAAALHRRASDILVLADACGVDSGWAYPLRAHRLREMELELARPRQEKCQSLLGTAE